MTESYCGKSCDSCTWRADLRCEGCQTGPGRPVSGDCAIAACCRGKGHETCATCGFLTGCPTRMGRENTPALRQSQRDREAERKKQLDENAPVLGKWLWVLFWLFIPSELGALMTNDSVIQVFPALELPGYLITVAVGLAYALVLWRLTAVGRRYRIAAVCALATMGSGLLTLAGFSQESAAWWLLSLPLMAVELVGVYQEFNAHAEALDGVDDELAEKWRTLWKWNIGLLGALFCCLFLVLVSGLLGALVLIAVSIAIVVVAVLKLVYLYRTAQVFRRYAAQKMEECA